jgi:hypothetical protein
VSAVTPVVPQQQQEVHVAKKKHCCTTHSLTQSLTHSYHSLTHITPSLPRSLAHSSRMSLRLLLVVVLVVALVLGRHGARAKRRPPANHSATHSLAHSTHHQDEDEVAGRGLRAGTSSGSEEDLVATDREQHRVTALPGLHLDHSVTHSHTHSLPMSFAGHLPCDFPSSSSSSPPLNFLFYWLFEKPVRPEEAPLTIWMNVCISTAPLPHSLTSSLTHSLAVSLTHYVVVVDCRADPAALPWTACSWSWDPSR